MSKDQDKGLWRNAEWSFSTGAIQVVRGPVPSVLRQPLIPRDFISTGGIFDLIILLLVTSNTLKCTHIPSETSLRACTLPRAPGSAVLPVSVPIAPGSLWGRALTAGGLSPCPNKKSPFGDMNLNEVGGKRRREQMRASSVTVCVRDRWGVARC